MSFITRAFTPPGAGANPPGSPLNPLPVTPTVAPAPPVPPAPTPPQAPPQPGVFAPSAAPAAAQRARVSATTILGAGAAGSEVARLAATGQQKQKLG
jgi:hypothetical protein